MNKNFQSNKNIPIIDYSQTIETLTKNLKKVKLSPLLQKMTGMPPLLEKFSSVRKNVEC